MNVLLIGKGNLAKAFLDYEKKNKDFKILECIDEYTSIQEYSNVDVIIDFSYKDAITTSLSLALKYNVPLIIGTTNYNKEQISLIKKTSKKIPICLESNYSLGFHLLKKFDEYISNLNIDKDSYVIETHQKFKKDKPSGSSKELKVKENNIFSLRGSSINGEHILRIFFENEELEIKHLIHSRLAFVNGVIKIIDIIKNKQKGLFNYDNLWEEIVKND